jgi:hypothetical protein
MDEKSLWGLFSVKGQLKLLHFIYFTCVTAALDCCVVRRKRQKAFFIKSNGGIFLAFLRCVLWPKRELVARADRAEGREHFEAKKFVRDERGRQLCGA